jgi:hypothetical protein
MESYANDKAFQHNAFADIFTNRDAGFEMLRSRYNTSKPDHHAKKHGAITLTRAALSLSGLDGAQTLGPFPTARSYRYVADLFRRERLTEGNRVLVPSTAVITPAASMVEEGDEKPEFTVDFTPAEVRLGIAAVHSKATKETADDITAFSNWMRTELARQLLVQIDDQLINGDGTAPNILGLLDWDPAIPTAATLPAAVAAVIAAGFQPTGIILSPTDYVGLADDDPAGWNGSLYGVPAVASPAVVDGAPIVGDFQSATIFEKYGPTFEVSEFNEDDFIMGLITARAHSRFLLAVPAAAAFCVVNAG